MWSNITMINTNVLTNKDFIDSILLPYVSSFKKTTLEMMVFDTSGTLLFVTKPLIENVYNQKHMPDELIGKKVATILSSDTNTIDFLYQLISHMQHKKEVIDTLSQKYGNKKKLTLFTNIPIMHNGDVIAVQSISRKIEPNQINEAVFKEYTVRFGINNTYLDNPLDIDLTYKEEILLALLILSYPQKVIAEVFQCSRSNIAKMISYSICPKLNITTGSTKLLVEKAIQMGYHQYLPRDLVLSPALNDIKYEELLDD